MTEEGFSISEEGGVNADVAEREARGLAARIISGDAASNHFREILYASNSLEYGRMIALRAANLVTAMALSQDVTISIVPLYSERLSTFIKEARMKMALFEPS
ncbi:hypothetical protein [uncultured Microbacterium sp.]|uniref:hypothetical protein n=1 Tax=uncultured Microbacterium sp. TaxID=191216 RepID=UPI0028D04A11|nr:hypothetical protein [uncultured Microbacterium sp.]